MWRRYSGVPYSPKIPLQWRHTPKGGSVWARVSQSDQRKIALSPQMCVGQNWPQILHGFIRLKHWLLFDIYQFSSNVQNVLGVHATCTNIPKLESPLYNLWSPSMQRVTLAVFGSLSSQLSCDLQVRVYIHLILCSLANPRLWAVLESESLGKARLDLV